MKQTIQMVAVSAATTVIMGVLMLSIAGALAAPTQAPPGGNPAFPLQGPAGPNGPTGPAGPTGPTGPAGTSIAPAMTISLNDFSQSNAWRCQDVNLQNICADGDGCRVRLIMHDKVNNNDDVRIIDEHITLEQISGSSSQTSGVTGWNLQAGGGDYQFFSGLQLNTVFDPWTIAYMFTYRHSNCYGANQGLQTYNFSVMTHPNWWTQFHFYD